MGTTSGWPDPSAVASRPTRPEAMKSTTSADSPDIPRSAPARAAAQAGPDILGETLHDGEEAAGVLRHRIEDEVADAQRLIGLDVTYHLGGRPAEERAVSSRGFGALGHDFERTPERQGDRFGIASRLLGPVEDDGDLVAKLLGQEHGGRAEADGMPAVGDLAGAAECHVGVAARPDRDAAFLPGLGHGAHRPHAIDAALPVNWLLRPARTHEGDVLVGNWPSPLERLRVERFELFLEPAHARPE